MNSVKPDLNQFIIDLKGSLVDAAYAINKNHSRCVLTVNNKKIEGIISEGDILRALLKGSDIHAPMRPFIRQGFYFLKKRNISEAMKIVRLRGISLIPILNDNMELVDVITLQMLISELNLINEGSDD
ncbi:CBS domain-containing protein [Alphaproteobacteria bacterium]|nr:CBS domain-containing protein [Alphaproteobacteria bacterium]